TSANSASLLLRLECRKSPEFAKALVDLFASERTEALNAELLTAETPHYGTIDNRAVQFPDIEVPIAKIEALLCQISDETAGKAVAGASGIEHVREKVTGNHEQGIAADQHGSVFAAFNY